MAAQDSGPVSVRELQRQLQSTGVCADCGDSLETQDRHTVTRFGRTVTVCRDCCPCTR